jgi:hypothetical protein
VARERGTERVLCGFRCDVAVAKELLDELVAPLPVGSRPSEWREPLWSRDHHCE